MLVTVISMAGECTQSRSGGNCTATARFVLFDPEGCDLLLQHDIADLNIANYSTKE